MQKTLLSSAYPVAPENAAILRTLNAFAVDVMSIRNADDLFWYVVRNVVGKLNFVDCVIYQSNDAQTELIQVAALGDKNPHGRTILNPLRIPFGQGVTGHAAVSRQAIIVDDLLKDQNYIPDTQPARSEICVPMISRGQVLGVIDSEHPGVGAFGEAELDVLVTVAAMTSAKLELLAEAETSAQRYHDLVRSHAQMSREIDARKALEAELFNARKLESIGRLTGGFAHIFNNILTVIAGNVDLAEADDGGDRSSRYLGDARKAVNRGAKSIRDMLAFSQRMPLKPEAANLNDVVSGTSGRNADAMPAEVALDLAPDLWPVRIDPVAAEVALVNLAMNARDAMPEGGTLRIKTENIEHDMSGRSEQAIDLLPGKYVRLSLTDEGHGIAPGTLETIFDPFFSTKPMGDGTGLGLSMVMGFVRQSGGEVLAKSAEGEGATFELYFPASSDGAAS